MTPQELKEAAQVMMDAANNPNRRVFWRPRGTGKWLGPCQQNDISWSWDEREYKLAPEPVEKWFVLNKEGKEYSHHDTKEGAEGVVTGLSGPALGPFTIKHFREVI